MRRQAQIYLCVLGLSACVLAACVSSQVSGPKPARVVYREGGLVVALQEGASQYQVSYRKVAVRDGAGRVHLLSWQQAEAQLAEDAPVTLLDVQTVVPAAGGLDVGALRAACPQDGRFLSQLEDVENTKPCPCPCCVRGTTVCQCTWGCIKSCA